MNILKKWKDWKARKKATAFAHYEKADAAALQALYNGEAEPEQQKRALSWIVHQASGMYEFNYFGSERDTSFALGRSFVGQQIIGVIKQHTPSERNE